MRMSGWTDKVRILDSTDADITSELGVVRGANHDINRGGVESRSAVNYEGKPAYANTGLSEHNAELVLHVDSLRAFGLIGETSGTSLVHSPGLPSFEFRQQITTTEYLSISGFKFGSLSVEISAPDEFFEISLSGQGLSSSKVTGVLEALSYSGSPLKWTNVPVKLNNTLIGGLQSATFNFERSLEPRGDVGVVSDDPQYIGEGPLVININDLTVDVVDSSAWDDVLNKVDDDELKVELPNGEVLVLKSITWDSADPDERTGEESIGTVSRSGVALDWEILVYGGS